MKKRRPLVVELAERRIVAIQAELAELHEQERALNQAILPVIRRKNALFEEIERLRKEGLLT